MPLSSTTPQSSCSTRSRAETVYSRCHGQPHTTKKLIGQEPPIALSEIKMGRRALMQLRFASLAVTSSRGLAPPEIAHMLCAKMQKPPSK